MKLVSYEDICAMKGNGSSMRHVLKLFIDKGATVNLLYENTDKPTTRLFIVDYENIKIPLRAYKLNFYSVFNSALAQSITSDKWKTFALLTARGISTPFTAMHDNSFDEQSFFDKYGTGVVKPAAMAAHGDGITLGVRNSEALVKALAIAQKINPDVIIQQQVQGEDHRLLFINYEFVAAVKRLPAALRGDGIHTIQELVEASNDKITELWDQIRIGNVSADSMKGSISKTPIDEIINARGRGFLDLVPAADSVEKLVDKANVSLGGQTYDVTDEVNVALTSQLSEMLRFIGLPICGVDVLSEDISSSPDDGKSFIIELNAAPGLRLHELPFEGQPRPVCAMIADSLIEYYKSSR